MWVAARTAQVIILAASDSREEYRKDLDAQCVNGPVRSQHNCPGSLVQSVRQSASCGDLALETAFFGECFICTLALSDL
jgi:hypothetical protein